MPLHVPSKLIIFVSTIVSTFISLLAGYLLYQESISVLRSAVEENSAAASKSARLRLAGMLDDVKASTDEGFLSFNRDDIMNVSLGIRYVNDIYQSQAFAALRSTEYGYGTAAVFAKQQYGSNASCTGCVPPWEDPEGYGRQSIWYDPILDSDGNDAKFWWASYVLGDTVVQETPAFNPITKEHKKFTTALNNNTGVYAPDVSHSHMIEPVEGLMAWMKSGINTTWSPVYFWTAVDGSPYAYFGYRATHNMVWNNERYILLMMGFFIFHPWTAIIREFKTENTELVALDSNLGQVFAHTIYSGPAIKFECYSICFTCGDFIGENCMMHPNDLGPSVADAVNSSKVRPRGTFFTADLSSTHLPVHIRYGKYFAASDVNKTTPLYKKDYFVDVSLDGGEYFLRLTHVYTASDTTFELLWMRSVSSVNDKVYAALVQLIIASVVIFGVDLIIAVLEIVLIARPLGRLVVGNQYLETMDLDRAEAHMNAMYKPIMVQEVACVTDGLIMAIEGLREYKAYLPNTLFVDDDTEKEEEVGMSESQQSSNHRTESQSMSSKHKPPAGQNLSMQLQSYRGTVVRLSISSAICQSPDYCDKFGQLVEMIQETAQCTRGLAHGFSVSDPLVFTLTWNVGLRCSESKTRAVSFCKSFADAACSISVSSMAVVHGEFTAGNLGSATHKGFGMNGACLPELKGISAAADVTGKALNRTITLVSPAVVEAATGKFELFAATLLRIDGMKKPFIVHEVGKEVRVKEEEWMYQLEEAKVTDPVAHALQEIIAHPESNQTVAPIKNPTDLQVWAARNIAEQRTVISYSHTAMW